MVRQYGLDIARLFAAYLVLFGHFAFGGSFSTDNTFRQWAGLSETLPLLDRSKQSLWRLDYFLLTDWQTSTAIIGVGLFFLISGWIVPPMLQRYSPLDFLINRIFRIFPMLIFAVAVAAAIQYWFGDRAALTIAATLSTALLISQYTDHASTLGVTWTLIIELKFYILLAVFGVLGIRKLHSINVGILAFYGIAFLFPSEVSQTMAHDLMYVSFMLIGTAVWQSVHGNRRLISVFANVLAFNFIRLVAVNGLNISPFQDLNLTSQLVSILLLFFCINIQIKTKNVRIKNLIANVANVTYSVYLLHISIGIFLLSRFRHVIDNNYMLLGAVTLVVTVLSAFTYAVVEKPLVSLGRNIVMGRRRATSV